MLLILGGLHLQCAHTLFITDSTSCCIQMQLLFGFILRLLMTCLHYIEIHSLRAYYTYYALTTYYARTKLTTHLLHLLHTYYTQ